jgi:hypothetical protein
MLFNRVTAKRAQRQLASMPIHTEQNAGQSSTLTGTRGDKKCSPRYPDRASVDITAALAPRRRVRPRLH